MPYKANRKGTKTPVERFWPKVHRTDTCWLWIAGKNHWGYGKFGICKRGPGSIVQAHRFSWELHFGPIPDGLFVLHRCDVPACVRPDHLFLGTALDNMQDMRAKGRNVTPKPNPRFGDDHAYRRHPEWIPRGEQASQSKLTEVLVRYIRAEYAAGRLQRELAAELGVGEMTISRAVRRESWSHVI